MQKRIRIGYSTANPLDQCAFYRSTGPLKYLERQYPDIEIFFIDQNNLNWGMLDGLDAILFSRPANENFLKGAKLAAIMGIPLWVDFDDDLYYVPWDNTESYHYNNEASRKLISTIVNMADHVTVSTPELKSINEPISRRISVIPNAWNFERFNYKKETPPIKENIIAWRGSPTHTQDLMCVKEEIIKFAKKNSTAKFVFFGFNPWMLSEISSQIQYHTIPMIEFNAVLWDLHPKLIIAPLHDCRFNRAKSNIAWLEGTHAGAVTVSCALPEWDKPGVMTSLPEGFGNALDYLFNNNDFCQEMHSISSEYIKNDLSLKKVNEQRYDVIMGLVYG